MQLFAVTRTRQGKPVSLLKDRSARALATVTRAFAGTNHVTAEIDSTTLVVAASSKKADSSLEAAKVGLHRPLLLGYGGPAPAEITAKFSSGDTAGTVGLLNAAHGMFACVLRSQDGNNLLFYTSLTRQIPLYLAETDELIAVSNSALFLGLMIRADLKPVYDRKGLAAFINSNNIFLERTLFENVRLLAINSFALLAGERLTTAECDTTVDTLSQSNVTNEKDYFDRLAETFTRGVKTAAAGRPGISMGLSGGKDSRLVLSGARAAGLGIKASTSQRFSAEADDRDVIIARQIAATFDLSHSVKGGEDLAATTLRTHFSPRDFALQTILMRDGIPGMLPRQPNHCRVGLVAAPATDTVTLSGLGGELLRGGYASPDLNWLRLNPQLVQKSAKLLKQKLTGHFTDLEPGLARELEGEIDVSIANYANRTNKPGLLELYYLMYNIGRSGAASYREAAARSVIAMPCCDNQLLREVFAAGQNLRLEERPHQEIMHRLLPGLADIELAEYKWGSGAARSTTSVTPVGLETSRQHYPIYMQLHGGLLEEIRDTVLASTEVNLIVSEVKLRELFAPPQINEPTRAAFIWTLYYASLLSNSAWAEAQPSRSVTVDHGRPWYNILREYRKRLGEELDAIKSVAWQKFCAQAATASEHVCAALADKFQSQEFFSTVAARNAVAIQDMTPALAKPVSAAPMTAAQRVLAFVGLRSATAPGGTPPAMDKAAVKTLRVKLLAQAGAVLTDSESNNATHRAE